MKTLLLVTIAVVVFICLGWWTIVNQKYHNFKRFLKIGDPIKFFIGEEKHYGRVIAFEDDGVIIAYHNETIMRNINDVYPVFGVRYE